MSGNESTPAEERPAIEDYKANAAHVKYPTPPLPSNIDDEVGDGS